MTSDANRYDLTPLAARIEELTESGYEFADELPTPPGQNPLPVRLESVAHTEDHRDSNCVGIAAGCYECSVTAHGPDDGAH